MKAEERTGTLERKMNNIKARVAALRDALYYAANPGGDCIFSEYRVRGGSKWKPLPLEARFINLARYDYRIVERNVWLSGDSIGYRGYLMPISRAKRIVAILRKRKSFLLAGYAVSQATNGALTVGCQTLSKEEAALGKSLLNAK